MKGRRGKQNDAGLEAAAAAINAAMRDARALERLKQRGWKPLRLMQGLRLAGDAGKELARKKTTAEYLQSCAARLKKRSEEARKVGRRFEEAAAKARIKHRSLPAEALGKGGRPEAGMFARAYAAFDAVLDDSAALKALKESDFARARVMDGRNSLAAYQRALADHQEAERYFRGAEESYMTARKELGAWMKGFAGAARAALRDRPELLKKITAAAC